MKTIFFLIFLSFLAILVQSHQTKKIQKDDRSDPFSTDSSSTSSEEATGKARNVEGDIDDKVVPEKKITIEIEKEDSGDDNWKLNSRKSSRKHGRKHRRRYYGDDDSDDESSEPTRPKPSKGFKCPADWMTFKRPQGDWCVKLFVGLMANLAAESQCRAMNATLTGLQNDEERMKLADAGKTIMLQNNYGDASIWLGARRKGSCSYVNMCFPKETFFWTDNHTTGIDGFGFSTGQPDAGFRNGWGFQSCVHQFIFSSGTTNARWPGIMHGALDDQYCQEGSVDPNVKMYACGKKANL